MASKSLFFYIISAVVAIGYIFIIHSVLKKPSTQSSGSPDSVEIRAMMNRYDELSALYNEKEKEVLNLSAQIKALKFTPGDAKNDIPSLPLISDENVAFKPEITGVIVLGMHRSGTSMLSGLMTKLGLNTGGPLIPPNFDNEKGFFERIDVVLMNDQIMRNQNIDYSMSVSKFNYLIALADMLAAERENSFLSKIPLIGKDEEVEKLFTRPEHKKNKFPQEARFALRFLNNPQNTPWMLKDPRLCVTLKFWLPLLSKLPAIVFSYRHPLDVARSLNNREKMFMGHAMKLWYEYNRMAIINSRDLCRVVVSSKELLTTTMSAMDHIKTGLRNCGMKLPAIADSFDEKTANEFIDLSLQHSSSSTEDVTCKGIIDRIDAQGTQGDGPKRYFYSLDNLGTINPPDSSKWESSDFFKHVKLYRESIRLFCAMENREAFNLDFPFNDEIASHNPLY